MLIITYNGIKPNQKQYDFSVIGNAQVDIVKFVLETPLNSLYTLEQLHDFSVYCKVQSAGKDYIDKIPCQSTLENILDKDEQVIGQKLNVELTLLRKTTAYRNIALQLQFETSGGEIVSQTQIVALTLSGTIPADQEISDKYPEAIQQLEGKVDTFDRRITKNTEDIAEIKAKGDTIVIDEVDDYLNEEGLKKIVRPMDDNGNVEKSYFIDKIHHESTLVKCEQHSKINGYDYNGEFDDLIDDLGNEQFYEIFGEDVVGGELTEVYSLYYNENTKGFKLGIDDFEIYGRLGLSDCTPNKVIRVIVGKYFEYDEQGNKVFDEHCVLYSDCFAENPEIEYREITEEKQVFELKTRENGSLYFDSDGEDLGFGDTRFILYGFECGEQAHDEYKAKEIGGGSESIIITLTKGESVRQIDSKTFLVMCERGLFTSNDLGTIASIPNLINGQTMRIRLIGLNHDVLSNTDLGELEPNGVKAKTTWQFYDMPFQKVNLGLPFEEEMTGYVRSSQPSDVPIEDCAEITIIPDAPSNMHGYTSAVGLLNAMQEIYNSLPNWLKDAIKTVRKDCFISKMSANGWNYENFDSTGTTIAYESDRYGSCINTKLFCLSATEIGIIPNPQETFNAFPYKIPVNNGNDVMLEGTKYEYFNETYPYTSEPEEDRRRPCKYNDQDWYYWLRSPYLLGSGGWGFCYDDGGVYYDHTYDIYGVAPAFCI